MSELTTSEALRFLEEVKRLEMERVALMGDASEQADKRIHAIGKRIEEVVVRLVRDTQNLPDNGHDKIMAQLDLDEAEVRRFAEYLGPVIDNYNDGTI